MKKIYLTLVMISIGLISGTAMAQCFPTLPAHAQTMPFGVNDSNFNHPGLVHHICFNGQYYYYGNSPDTVYLEGSARLIIGFSYNLTIFMSSNAQLIIDTTTSGIYDIKKIVCDTAYTIFVDTSFAVIDSFVECPGLTFNYSNFPHNISPCYTLGIDPDEEYDFNVFPTVTDGEIKIDTDLDEFIVRVYDLSGRLILHGINSNFISIGDHSPGMYLVALENKLGQALDCRKVMLIRN